MSVEVLATAAVAVVALAGGAYAYVKRGGSAEVDVDGDGNPELDLSESTAEAAPTADTTEGADSRDSSASSSPEQGSGGEEVEDPEPPADPTPERVQNIGIDTDDITGIGQTRAADLAAAGYETAADIYYASDENLEAVDGIGSYTVEQIRGDIGPIGDEADEGKSSEESATEDDTESDQS